MSPELKHQETGQGQNGGAWAVPGAQPLYVQFPAGLAEAGRWVAGLAMGCLGVYAHAGVAVGQGTCSSAAARGRGRAVAAGPWRHLSTATSLPFH